MKTDWSYLWLKGLDSWCVVDVFLALRACTWCTIRSSYQTLTPSPYCCSVSLGITFSAPPTIRKICSAARRAPAPSGGVSPPTSSVRTCPPTAAATAASFWPQGSGEWRVTSTTLATWWVPWLTVPPVALATFFHTSTLFTWPSCWSTAVCETNTAAAASTGKTGDVTPTQFLTGWFLDCFKERQRRSWKSWWNDECLVKQDKLGSSHWTFSSEFLTLHFKLIPVALCQMNTVW